MIDGSEPKILRVIAHHAGECNMPSYDGPEEWDVANASLNTAYTEIGHDPTKYLHSAQVHLTSTVAGQGDEQLVILPEFKRIDCEYLDHFISSVYRHRADLREMSNVSHHFSISASRHRCRAAVSHCVFDRRE
ncbi:hypothetical protein DIJ64_07990 [Mycobacterium leprae]|uniref:Uncharacterized protein n=1 Tax=Mycobacterium leprae TaxID=1769 RepID=A0AAD0KWM3_MYCLR|nr:hypothetical protein DIJ64_07990 [Mycobacterium leprae]